MELYGDESGHLRSLLEGDEDLFVLAVVVGDPECCVRCPKRTVRDVRNIEEAKWSELTDTQRRRMIECLAGCKPSLSFGYVTIKQSDLLQLQDHYRLYEDDLRYGWDLCVIADCYASISGELLQGKGAHTFTFDRLFSKKMSERVIDMMTEMTPELEVRHADSRKVTGIQTADCFAGAVREDRLRKQNWLDELEEVSNVTESALATVEERLLDLKTGP
jgi:hypothetical protein